MCEHILSLHCKLSHACKDLTALSEGDVGEKFSLDSGNKMNGILSHYNMDFNTIFT